MSIWYLKADQTESADNVTTLRYNCFNLKSSGELSDFKQFSTVLTFQVIRRRGCGDLSSNILLMKYEIIGWLPIGEPSTGKCDAKIALLPGDSKKYSSISLAHKSNFAGHVIITTGLRRMHFPRPGIILRWNLNLLQIDFGHSFA